MVAAERKVRQKISYAEYLAMPEINRRYEIVNGKMIMNPAPTVGHQLLLMNVFGEISPFVKRKQLGVALPAPVDILIRKSPLKTRQPDITFMNTERTGVKGRAELKAMPVIVVPPDLVVEVLSPGGARRMVQSKLQDYIKIGVRECWIISPEAETVEILQLTTGEAKRIQLLGSGDTLRSEILPGFKMKVDEIFS